MKRAGKSKRTPVKNQTQKITDYFKSKPESSNSSKSSSNNILSSEDEVIEATPQKYPVILKEVTNRPNSPPHSTPNVDKKRKVSLPYTDEIPELDVTLPQRKKPCVVKNGFKIVSIGNITLDEFKGIQDDLEKQAEERRNSWMDSLECIDITTTKIKTPTKSITPSKSGQTTPSTKKKRTPNKLFLRSPNVKEFKVEILQNFIIVSPSKENKLNIPQDNGERTPTKVEEDIKMLKAKNTQNMNETTPVSSYSSISEPRTTPSSKVKAKLDFNLSNTYITNLAKPGCSKNNDYEANDNIEDYFLDDSWENEDENVEILSLNLSKLQHCKILKIIKNNQQQTITVQSTKNDEKAICNLHHYWGTMKLNVNDIIYIMALKQESNNWVVDCSHGLVIYEPDFLISSTTVVGSLFCKRKSVLKERYAGFDTRNKAMAVGILVHSLLQSSLRNSLEYLSDIKQQLENILKSRETTEALYESNLTYSEVKSEMEKYVDQILHFQQQYMSHNVGKFERNINKGNWRGRIDAIHDIEENIWCTEFGLKGKIDISVQVDGVLTPLELKTGRASMSLEHRGQLILYIMMMNKLGYKTTKGLLLYLREGVLKDIPINNKEKRDLIMLRNELVYYLTRRPNISTENNSATNSKITIFKPSELPPPINHHSACRTCEYNLLCGVNLKSEQFNLSDFKLLNEVQGDITQHLKPSHIEYFMHWSGLVQLEMTFKEGKSIRDIYTKSPEIREQNGGCVANMHVIGDVNECNGLYSNTFEKYHIENNFKPGWNMLACGIGEGSYVIVSTNGRPAVAAGLVTYIDYKSITVELDRDVTQKYRQELFHLDTYESQASNTFLMSNLALLLEPTQRAMELRELIIDKKTPTIKKHLSGNIALKVKPFLQKSNHIQQAAIIKALSANDYLLIKGMPGTGKTATIVSLIVCLAELNQTVLITSHTHSAVDNVCIRLQECGLEILRLGAQSRIHPSLKTRSDHYQTRNCKTVEDLEAIYNSANIVAVTCLGSRHPLVSKRTFDVCIIDESTQVLQCSLFRALNAARRFILIGDPDQLPPIVKNKDALENGMAESLFERLQTNKSLTVTLQYNYRMNKTITKLANDLTYKGQLLIGNEQVSNATLRLPKFESIIARYKDMSWVLKILDDNLNKAVCILDTGPVWNRIMNNESKGSNDDSFKNIAETAIVCVLVQALIKGGLSPNSIGIIAPYRLQVAQLTCALSEDGIDVNTVDQYQGKDKEVIIYSCTKSRDISKQRKVTKFEILEDHRRLTVAVTRAKHKFILIADVQTLNEYAPFEALFNSIEKSNYLQLVNGKDGFFWDKIIRDCKMNLSNT